MSIASSLPDQPVCVSRSATCDSETVAPRFKAIFDRCFQDSTQPTRDALSTVAEIGLTRREYTIWSRLKSRTDGVVGQQPGTELFGELPAGPGARRGGVAQVQLAP